MAERRAAGFNAGKRWSSLVVAGALVASVLAGVPGVLGLPGGTDAASATPTAVFVAGNPDVGGYVDSSTPANVRFNGPQGVALSPDESTLYVADSGNNKIRAVNTTTGATTTLATLPAGETPHKIAVGGDGSLYVTTGTTPSDNALVLPDGPDKVVKVTAGGSVSDVASGFYTPIGIGFDSSGTMWVADGDRTCNTPGGCTAILRVSAVVGGTRQTKHRFDHWNWFSAGVALTVVHDRLLLQVNGMTVYDPPLDLEVSVAAFPAFTQSDITADAAGRVLYETNGRSVDEWDLSIPAVAVSGVNGSGGATLANVGAVVSNRAGTRVYDAVGWGGIYLADFPLPPTSFSLSETRGGSNPSELCWRCVIGDPVGPDQGDLIESATDLGVSSRGGGLAVARTYDSAVAATDSPFGFGWAANNSMSVVYNALTPAWTVNQENGSTATFVSNGTGGWTAPPRVLGTLTEGASTVTFTRKAADTFVFDKATGHLNSITDLNSNTRTFAYDGSGHLSTVTDSSSSRKLTYTWSGSPSRITGVADDIGRAVGYHYDGSGNLDVFTDVRGGQTLYGYDGSHRLTQITDPRGIIVTKNHYDGSGRVDWQQDAAGVVSTNKTIYAYSTSAGGLATTTVTSPEGRVTVMMFDGNGELVSKVDGSGTGAAVTTTIAYDQVCMGTTRVTVTSAADPTLHTNRWSYDQSSCVVTDEIDSLGHTVHYASFNALRQPQSITDRNGHTTTITYDTRGNRTGSSAPIDGSTNQTLGYTYGDAVHPGDVTQSTDAEANNWSSAYNAAGDLTQSTDPATAVAGAITTYTYDSAGRPVSTVSPNGNVSGGTPNTYRTAQLLNAANQPAVQFDANGSPIVDGFGAPDNSALGSLETTQTWTNLTPAWSIQGGAAQANGAAAISYVSMSGNGTTSIISKVAQTGTGLMFRQSTASANRNFWSVRADTSTQQWKLYKLVNNVLTLVGSSPTGTCCAAGQLVTARYNGSNISVYVDATLVISATDSALSTAPRVGLFAASTGVGRIDGFASAVDPGGATLTAYDAAGHATASVDPLSNRTTFVYDNNGRLTETHRADGTVVKTGYSGDGLMVSQTDGANNATTYNYDAAGRLTWTKDPLLRQTSYTYTAVGNPKTVTDADGKVTTYTYDAAERVTNVDYSSSGTPDVTFTYDDNGNRLTMVDGTGSWSYTYDFLNRLKSSTQNLGGGVTRTVSTTYDKNGHVTATAYPNSVGTVTRHYDAAGRQDWLTDWLSATHTTFGYDRSSNLTSQVDRNGITSTYTYDHADRTTNIAHKKGAATVASWAYTRDVAGQLTGTTSTGVGGAETYTYNTLNQLTASLGTFTHTYDSADNLTRLGNGTTQQFDAANQLTTQKDTGGSVTATFSYDNEGNRTAKAITAGATTTYGYDQANRFTGIPSVTQNVYNGDGIRTRLTASATNQDFTWDFSRGLPQLVTSTVSGTDTHYIYGPDGLPMEQITGTTATWLQHDQIGSTRLLTDGTGTKVGDYTYTPYGQVSSHSGTAATNLQYTGEWAEGDFVYLRARWYDSGTGQFLSRDWAVDTTRDPYSYVSDGPTNGRDPSGLCSPVTWIKSVFSIGDKRECEEEDEASADSGPEAAVVQKMQTRTINKVVEVADDYQPTFGVCADARAEAFLSQDGQLCLMGDSKGLFVAGTSGQGFAGSNSPFNGSLSCLFGFGGRKGFAGEGKDVGGSAGTFSGDVSYSTSGHPGIFIYGGRSTAGVEGHGEKTFTWYRGFG